MTPAHAIKCAVCQEALRTIYVPLDDTWRAHCAACGVSYVESAETPRYFRDDKGIDPKPSDRRRPQGYMPPDWSAAQ